MTTKFEMVGVGLQQEAATPEEAIQKFKYSCNVCCCRGIKLDCDRCAIAATHGLVMASFNIPNQVIKQLEGVT